MEPNSGELSESVFFTARKAIFPFYIQESGGSASTSSSSRYHSARICTLMECKRELGMSQEDAEIEASKGHWTEMESKYNTLAASGSMESSTLESGLVKCVEEELTEAEKVMLLKENVEAMLKLQDENPESHFFEIGGTLLGRKIAEGGQAEIYDGGSKRYVNWNGNMTEMIPIVLKVFKVGYSLCDQQKTWPLALLRKCNLTDGGFDHAFNPMFCGRLLEDGRFAFEMVRWWGDLWKLLDVRLQHNGNRHPPLMMLDGNYHECCMMEMMLDIAKGMGGLHEEGTLHRDLKASNVLIESSTWGISNRLIPSSPNDIFLEEDQLDPLELDHDFGCFVVDYECSVGVVGTGFWRAPEVLEAVKNRTVYTNPNLFTPKSDVYSYAMTCYEILTGLVPFEDPEDQGTSIDNVLRGKRPTLPNHLKPWVEELFHNCWHMDPLERPSFEEIVSTLEHTIAFDPCCQKKSVFFRDHYLLSDIS